MKHTILLAGALAIATALPALAAEGDPVYDYTLIEADIAEIDDETVGTWDAQGWVGGDYNRFWWKTEGAFADGESAAVPSADLASSRNVIPGPSLTSTVPDGSAVLSGVNGRDVLTMRPSAEQDDSTTAHLPHQFKAWFALVPMPGLRRSAGAAWIEVMRLGLLRHFLDIAWIGMFRAVLPAEVAEGGPERRQAPASCLSAALRAGPRADGRGVRRRGGRRPTRRYAADDRGLRRLSLPGSPAVLPVYRPVAAED